jgi:hypothetical protein
LKKRTKHKVEKKDKTKPAGKAFQVVYSELSKADQAKQKQIIKAKTAAEVNKIGPTKIATIMSDSKYPTKLEEMHNAK